MAVTRDSILKETEGIQISSSELVDAAEEAARDGKITRDTFLMLSQLDNLVRMLARLVELGSGRL